MNRMVCNGGMEQILNDYRCIVFAGATCVVASPAERDKGGSGGFAEAL
jgi:hypothetical protein